MAYLEPGDEVVMSQYAFLVIRKLPASQAHSCKG